MKTIVILAVNLFIFISSWAQSLDEIALRINRPTGTSELMAARAQLERMSSQPEADWLTFYYLAYADLELSFRMENTEHRSQYINEAQNYLKKINGGDKSEVETLRGYVYFALMAIDPATNGPKYYTDIISCYSKALDANPDNPRALLLNAIFMNNMTKSMGGQYKQFEADVVRSRELFEKQDSISVNPHWGGFYLQMK